MDQQLCNLVRNDIRCHRENGVDLNPFSTAGARDSWGRGFDGQEPLNVTYLDCYNRGKLCAQLLLESQLNPEV